MSTSVCVESNIFNPKQDYRVRLSLTRKEIELLTYTWNQMITGEPVCRFNANTSSIPGAFKSNVAIRATNSVSSSSIFCSKLYYNLLNIDPTFESFFPSVTHSSVSLAGVISLAISQLENLSRIEEYLSNLGRKHLRILGIEPAHFEFLGEVLILTFHEILGAKFNMELEILWIKFYMYLANSLLQHGQNMDSSFITVNPNHNPYSVSSKLSTYSNQVFDISNVSTGRNSFMEKQSPAYVNQTAANGESFVFEKKPTSYKAKIKQKGSNVLPCRVIDESFHSVELMGRSSVGL